MPPKRSGRKVQPSLKATEIAMSKAAVKKTAAKPESSAAATTKAKPAPKAAPKPKSSAGKKTATTAKATANTKTKATTTAPANATGKRGRPTKDEEDDGEEAPLPVAKKARGAKGPVVKQKVVINQAPTERLDVFVFGEGSNSELGLGTAKSAIDVKRPRLNPLLSAKDVGVVHIAAGGMHVAALTHDGKVLTWGVNDSGSLGRDTTWDAGLKDMDAASDDSDDDDSGLNPKESTPTAVPASSFPEGTAIVKLAAGDNITLALTDDGQVYGWGTFRNHSGILGFYKDKNAALAAERAAIASGNPPPQNAGLIETQTTPRLYTELHSIVDIACGSNHCMALDTKGLIHIWGCGEQNQLGHHINERLDVEQKGCLYPSLLRTGTRKYKAIYTGADHCFAIDTKDQVWSWGLNSFGATGIAAGAGDDNAAVYTPSLVKALNNSNSNIVHMAGGQHHSIAITSAGQALVFGRTDGAQTGLDLSTLPDSSLIRDENNVARIVIVPTPLPHIGTAVYASAGTDTSIVLNKAGLAYSWGFGANYQTGQGVTSDIATPTHIDNTAVRGKVLKWSGCGGQYSLLAAPAGGGGVANGVGG